jgi:hypothetical protein
VTTLTTLELHWRCYGCDEHGDGARSNAAAEKHTAATKHATCTWSTP